MTDDNSSRRCQQRDFVVSKTLAIGFLAEVFPLLERSFVLI
jgi:hypothetical protein